ncbi:hypothetical protein [Spongiivirga citrea]|uniref:T9SS C-terminal target domain-containing protein n=1 Tax=Spongiivirga citrea TaxID=1481457 RepID=A0A6M0CHW1_9FLAO|nr:hypothetical protein [Spongiivirga citrea]NER17451.1 hypothetical protein [Spongiivirga citrea]
MKRLLFIGIGIALITFISLSFVDFKVVTLHEMDKKLAEASGLLYYKGDVITFNDSGNSSELFAIDLKTGEIKRTVSLFGAKNIEWSDWEDITEDENYIYLGDIGNFYGYRDFMNVYRIKKSDFDNKDVVAPEAIKFKYKDFQDKVYIEGGIDYDAEALCHIDGKLFLFSKEWKSGKTTAYEIPKEPSDSIHLLTKGESFEVDGLISGGAYDSKKKNLFLTGYTRTLQPFLYEINDVTADAIFDGKITKHDLKGTGFTSQIEGVTYHNSKLYLISERIEKTIKGFNIIVPGKLYQVNGVD